MADTKTTDLTAITTPASGDKLYIVDVSDTTDSSAGSSRQITRGNFISGLATSGANSDITSLTGLTTALTVAQGGTGAITHTSGNVLLGAGTGAITSVGSSGTGNVVRVTSPVLTTPQINDTSADHQYIFAVSELAADRTVTLPLLTGNDTFVFAAHTQALTNKTLTTPIIASLYQDAGKTKLMTVPNTASDTLAAIAATQTFTNKRNTKRVTTIVSSATPTVNTDNCDVVTITALATAITSMTTNLTGTETNFQTLIFRILDNGTGRAITWGAAFEPRGVALPTTTTASKLLTVGFIYDTVDSIWGCVAVSDEA